MTKNNRHLLRLAAIAFPMTSAVIFGAGITAVLSISALENHLAWAVPAVVIASFPLGALAAWLIAPRMRARHPRDAISG